MRDPTKSAQAWVTGLSAATQKITDGINAVTTPPNQLAAQAAQKYMQNTAAAVSSGLYAAANNAVGLQGWKVPFLAKISRIASGAQASLPKMTAYLTKLKPQMDTLQSQIASMPRNTIEDSIARSNALIRGMHALKGSFK